MKLRSKVLFILIMLCILGEFTWLALAYLQRPNQNFIDAIIIAFNEQPNAHEFWYDYRIPSALGIAILMLSILLIITQKRQPAKFKDTTVYVKPGSEHQINSKKIESKD